MSKLQESDLSAGGVRRVPVHLESKTSIWWRHLSVALFFIICVETIFSVPYRTVALATQSNHLAWVAGLAACLLGGVAFFMRAKLLSFLESVGDRISPERLGWLIFWLVVGIVLRLFWAVEYHIALKSDGLAYFKLAQGLAESHTYNGTYWPPGFALFLTPFFMVLGAHVWVVDLCALLSFAGTYWLTYKLGMIISGRKVAGLACALVAVWPTHVMSTSANVKELFLAVLILGATFLYLVADERKGLGRVGYFVATGVLLGFAALVQPGYLLYPGVLLLSALLRNKRFFSAVVSTAIVSVAVLVTVSPWTYRNYQAIHHFVLISTNGGSVFYAAANPDANAGYTDATDAVLPKDPYAADKEGYRKGKEWVRENPGKFAVLMVRKQVGFLGDDGVGAYETMKRGYTPPRKFYGEAKVLCCVWWLAAMFVIFIGASKLFDSSRWPLWFGICFLPLVYQWTVDSIFVSAGRHHLPYMALTSLLVALVAIRANGKTPEVANS